MKLRIASAVALTSLAVSANAQLVFTVEAPGVQSSSVSGVTTETFDSFATGALPASSLTVGNVTAGLQVYTADQYGGANGSQFVRPIATSVAKLTLPSAQNYFGMWWSAGDALNFLEFFDGATSLGVYNVGTIIPALNASYYGNPNPPAGRNTGEPYSYLNFTTLGSTHITSVNFSGANFEFDNLSITDEEINPPGTLPGGGQPPGRDVPDGGATAALLGGGILAISALRRKLRA